MPFNLRGGRPKNMKQGIYWVQRHQADQKRAAAAARSEVTKAAKEARQKEKAAQLIANYERLFENVKSFFDNLPEFSANQIQTDKITATQAEWEAQRAALVDDPHSISLASLKKFGTAGKNLIAVCAGPAGIETKWLAANRQLRVGSILLDFS